MNYRRLFGWIGLIYFSSLYGNEIYTGVSTFSMLTIPLSPRGAAMGGAFCGLSDEVSGIRCNPAGITEIKRSEAEFLHREWFQGFKEEFGGIVFHTKKGNVGLSFLYSTVTGIEGRDEKFRKRGEFNVWEGVFSVGYGKGVFKMLNLGVSMDLLYQNFSPNIEGLEGDKGKGIGLNVGFLWKTEIIKVGGVLQNIGSPVVYFYGGREKLPQNLKIGASFPIIKKIVMSFDANFPKFGENSYHLGTEYWISENFFAIRSGFTTKECVGGGGNFTCGFGIKLKEIEFPRRLGDIELNYAYVGYGTIGNTHRLSVKWIFGEPERIRTGGIVVKVFDVEKGTPLRAIVTVDGEKGFRDTTVTSPHDGKVSIKCVPIGKALINVEKDFYTKVEDTVWVEWGERVEVSYPLRYTGPKGIPPDKLVKEGICGRILLGQLTEEGKRVPLRNGIVYFQGPRSGKVEVDSDGWYKIPNLPPGSYVLTVESAYHDYFPEIIPNVVVEHEKATLLHCTLKKVKTLRLFFETDRAYVHPRDYPLLDTLASFMRRYKENKFEIHGHTDPRPPRRFKNNQELSYARAWAVANYLIKKGIEEERLVVKGWGATKPIAPNDTEEGMALNRRIEVIIISPYKK
jgi:outer membrane protein OmpA-like peptidoglycan-associated protein